MNRQSVGGATDQADRCETGDRIVSELLVKRRADRQGCDVAGEQRVSVRRRVRGYLGSERSGRAAPIVYDDLLAKTVAQRGGHDARDDVRRAARRERHDVAQRSIRKLPGGLRHRAGRRERQQYQGNDKAHTLHRLPPASRTIRNRSGAFSSAPTELTAELTMWTAYAQPGPASNAHSCT